MTDLAAAMERQLEIAEESDGSNRTIAYLTAGMYGAASVERHCAVRSDWPAPWLSMSPLIGETPRAIGLDDFDKAILRAGRRGVSSQTITLVLTECRKVNMPVIVACDVLDDLGYHT